MSEHHDSDIRPRADWRNPEHYRHMLDYDRVSWAGEWLRRNPQFVADIQKATCKVGKRKKQDNSKEPVTMCKGSCDLTRWGLSCCHTKNAPAFFWHPQQHPHVLTLEAAENDVSLDGIDLKKCPLLKSAIRSEGNEWHLLFGDHARNLQVVVKGHAELDRPLLLRHALQGWRDFTSNLLQLQRFLTLYYRGRLPASLYPKERRADRWIEMLRVWDGLQSGASHRDIACTLYGKRIVQDAWDNGYRLRLQRLARSSRQMVNGDYQKLLGRKEDGAHPA